MTKRPAVPALPPSPCPAASALAGTATPHRGRPRAEESALIAERILDAAWLVLMELGPELFSMDRVALAAQASKQTIYARHAGKLPLLEALLADRMGLIYADLRELIDAPRAEEALADQARRAVKSMIGPTSRILDRLIDWIDGNSPDAPGSPTRAALYRDSLALIREQLGFATRRWGLMIDDIPAAAEFWLDGLLGHARGLPSDALQSEDWPRRYARYFLRAVVAGGTPDSA